jgi:hypothetical protein
MSTNAEARKARRLGGGILLALAAAVAWRATRTGARAPLGIEAAPPEGAEAMARELATILRDPRGALGSVEVASERLVVGGRVRLDVQAFPSEGGAATAHFHVLAKAPTAEQRSIAGFDACVVGTGLDRASQIQSAADSYASLAFPVVWSSVKGEPLLTATAFHGTEVWGVHGYRGFLGPPGARGLDDLDRAFQAPMFERLPRLPADGHPHLLKVILHARDDGWHRTVELDGHDALVKDERWDGAPVPTTPAMIVRFAIIERADTLANEGARADAIQRLSAKPSWLYPATDCPADVMPQAFSEHTFSDQSCRGGRLLDCARGCEAGSTTACYEAAQELHRDKHPSSEPLFLRSCRLGYASACTNAAAGRLLGKPADDCSFRTFTQVCERAGDPWACTMTGAVMLHGERGRRDVARARAALGKSCTLGQDDPACVAAQKLLGELDGGL